MKLSTGGPESNQVLTEGAFVHRCRIPCRRIGHVIHREAPKVKMLENVRSSARKSVTGTVLLVAVKPKLVKYTGRGCRFLCIFKRFADIFNLHVRRLRGWVHVLWSNWPFSSPLSPSQRGNRLTVSRRINIYWSTHLNLQSSWCHGCMVLFNNIN